MSENDSNGAGAALEWAWALRLARLSPLESDGAPPATSRRRRLEGDSRRPRDDSCCSACRRCSSSAAARSSSSSASVSGWSRMRAHSTRQARVPDPAAASSSSIANGPPCAIAPMTSSTTPRLWQASTSDAIRARNCGGDGASDGPSRVSRRGACSASCSCSSSQRPDCAQRSSARTVRATASHRAERGLLAHSCCACASVNASCSAALATPGRSVAAATSHADRSAASNAAMAARDAHSLYTAASCNRRPAQGPGTCDNGEATVRPSRAHESNSDGSLALCIQHDANMGATRSIEAAFAVAVCPPVSEGAAAR